MSSAPSTPPESPVTGPVLVIGVGLIGTSVAHALTRAGIQTHLRDADPNHVWVAASMGAGSPGPIADPRLVVVAVPPDLIGPVVVDALREFPAAIVTDTGSVKGPAVRYVAEHADADACRYVGGHPMAGLERSGPLAAGPELFVAASGR